MKISSRDVTQVLIQGNTFNTTYAGIDFAAAANTITDLVISNNAFTGMTSPIFLRFGVTSEFIGCSITYNVFRGTVYSVRPYNAGDVDTPAGWTIWDNEGVHAKYLRKFVYVEIVQPSGVAVGDVVAMRGTSQFGYGDALEAQKTADIGSSKVLGVAVTAHSNNQKALIQVGGKCLSVKVSGTAAIAIDDLLSTHDAAGIAQKAASGECAFAVALEAYANDDDAGVISAYLISPRQVT